MKEEYFIDVENYSLQKIKKSLKNRDMIPSRVILKEKIEERFQMLKSNGIDNLKVLTEKLRTKQQIEVFSQKSKLSIEYLTILNREAKSYLPNPIPLNKFSGINIGDIKKLSEISIKNTKQLFNKARTNDDINLLNELTKIPIERIKELVSLSDISRLYGVGPVFARMIYDVGVTSVKLFVKHSPEEFIEIYENETKKKADFGVSDIKFSIELARELES